MMTFSYSELNLENQILYIINGNMFEAQINFKGSGNDSKLLGIVIMSASRINGNLFQINLNVTLYNNDKDKSSDNAKFYTKVNLTKFITPFQLLLKIFDKVITSNLIHNTNNYNNSEKGLLSIKVYPTKN
jgi:hypothetical protein